MKRPKLIFLDSGLLCHLIGIENAKQLETHPLRGAVFESWVVSEVVKAILNRGQSPRIYFYRDQRGTEVDLLLERGGGLVAIEAKSSRTPSSTLFAGLKRFGELFADRGSGLPVREFVVYGGDETQKRREGTLLPWSDVARVVESAGR